MIDLYSNGLNHQAEAMRLLSAGITVRGGKCRTIDLTSNRHLATGETCVVWGTRYLDDLDGRYQNVVVMERGYFRDRMRYYSLGLNGLNGRADFKNADSPPDRWQQHGVRVEPWRTGGDYLLLMAQVPGDMATKGVDLASWYRYMVEVVPMETSMPLRFRPHPAAPGNYPRDLGIEIDPVEQPLADALAGAAGVITYNSNSAVDAVLAGVPAYAEDEGSMAWDVAAWSIKELINFEPVERLQWAFNLAYAQWSTEEIMNGAAWAHLMGDTRE